MAHVTANRVSELSSSTGTGALALTSASGYRRFNAALATGDTCWYMVEAIDANGAVTGAYEFGVGTYSAADTLTRTTVLGSSNANSVVSFGAGNKRVTLTILAPDTSTGAQWRNALGVLANPMTTAGDLIVGSTGGTPVRLAKGANNTFLGVDSSGNVGYFTPTTTASSNANTVQLNGLAGPTRTVENKLQRMPDVFDFGAIGTGRNTDTKLSSRYGTLAAAQAVYPFATSLNDQIDWAALQALCNWMQTNSRPVSLAGAKLNINRPVIMGAGYCRIEGNNAEIGGQFQTAGKINSTVAADLSYPTTTTVGCLDGCVFYFPATIYYAYLENINFYDLRFCICHNYDPNSPTYRNLYFGYCNVGILHYQGTQTPAMINCGGDQLGVAHISSATCFPAGHPRAGVDNFYTDGFKMINAVSGEFESFGIVSQPAFDAWFIASILRPTTDSVTQVGTNKYTDSAGTVYTNVYTDPKGKTWPDGYFLNPTGRVIFIPYRTTRLCFTFTMQGADTRGTVVYGYALVGTEVNALKLEDNNYEGMFNYDNILGDRPVLLTVGAVRTGTVQRQSQISYIEGDHGLLLYTGRGISAGKTDGSSLVHLGTNPIIKKNEKTVGFTNDTFRHLSINIPIVENYSDRAQGYTGGSYPKDYRFDVFDEKIVFSNQETQWMRYTVPRFIQLPSLDTNGVLRNDAIISYIENFCGYMHVQVWNHTTGEMDYAIYQVDTYQAETLTLAAAVANGDTVVTFTSAPRLISGAATRLCTWRPGGTGNGFSTDLYLGGNQVRVVNRVAGLPATLASGTTVQRSQKVAVVKAFAGNWAYVTSIGLGNALVGQESSQIGLKNVNNHTLTFAVWYSHFAAMS